MPSVSTQTSHLIYFFFFFNDTATTEIYTLSLHDALPISSWRAGPHPRAAATCRGSIPTRSEEHTSELQSRSDLVCRLLLEKKKQQHTQCIKRMGRRAGWRWLPFTCHD